MRHESSPAQNDMTPEQLLSPEFEYHLLTGHNRTNGSFKTTEQLHTEYVRLTDNLVYQMVDGVEVTNPESGTKSQEKVDTVVWLDKSARPLAWLTKDLWPLLAADAEGNVPDMPNFKFVNIDRNQWTSSVDPSGLGVSDINALDQSIIRSLRSIFLKNPADRQNGITEEIDVAPSLLDGKTVLIVDEVYATGRTLDYAQKFFRRAFPDAKVAGTHWMRGITTNKSGATGNRDLPVWYTDNTKFGRGIDNKNIDASLSSSNSTQRLGARFLSAALREQDQNGQRITDPLSDRMRNELHQLALDAKAGKVLIEPSRLRDDDDLIERALRLNHLSDLDQYKQARQQQAS